MILSNYAKFIKRKSVFVIRYRIKLFLFIFKAIGTHTVGFPKIHYFGICAKYNALVMEMLGPNLEQLFNRCERIFCLKTILQIAIQLIKRIERIHSSGIVYR